MFEHEMEESKKVSLTEDFAHKYLYVVKKGKCAENLTEEGEYCVIVREWRGGTTPECFCNEFWGNFSV